MPLRDHFRPRRIWQEVLGGWPAIIVQHLNSYLPNEYRAGPKVHLGSPIEVGAATDGTPVEKEDGSFVALDPKLVRPDGTVVPAPGPTLSIEAEIADFDEYEVRINDDRGRLVAAIELISPGNLDRPDSRNPFVTKCAGLLQREVALILVDLVTDRQTNLYDDLIDRIGQRDPAVTDPLPPIYAAAVRWRPIGRRGKLESWYHPLSVGGALPELPLWLSDDLAVTVALETTYEQTLRDLRMA